MPRGPRNFRESDVKRVIRAAEKAGKAVLRVIVRPGEIEVDTGSASTKDAEHSTNFFDGKLGFDDKDTNPKPAPLPKPPR
jgi:hypothetical protein